jgi:hypothetical protein
MPGINAGHLFFVRGPGFYPRPKNLDPHEFTVLSSVFLQLFRDHRRKMPVDP